MVEKLYSDFDTDLVIRAKESKTFRPAEIKLDELKKLKGIANVSLAVEETVVLKHEQKWVNAQMIGVEPTFLKMTKMHLHMVDGYPTLNENGVGLGIIGASLLDKLQGYIPSQAGYESLVVYGPKRNIKMRLGTNPFTTERVQLAGRMNFNRDVNENFVVLPIEQAQQILGYKNEVTSFLIDVENDVSLGEAQNQVQTLVGDQFKVKTSYEKNALIYQTSKTEKLIVLAILIFIFILASFNLVASLVMLYIEKRDDADTVYALGANKRTLFNIFFYEGLLISGKGILLGGIIGYGVCFAQLKWSLLTMPNSHGESFPIRLSAGDGVLIITLVSLLCFLASYSTIKMLMRKS